MKDRYLQYKREPWNGTLSLKNENDKKKEKLIIQFWDNLWLCLGISVGSRYTPTVYLYKRKIYDLVLKLARKTALPGKTRPNFDFFIILMLNFHAPKVSEKRLHACVSPEDGLKLKIFVFASYFRR